MVRRLARCAASFVPACLAAPLLSGCYGDFELLACTYSDPTSCDDGPASASATTGTTGETTGGAGGSGASGGAVPTSDGPEPGPGSTDATVGGPAGSTGEPSDPPPWVSDLVCDPASAEDVGPTVVTYTASPDAIAAELLDDGVVIASAPVGEPLVFPVISAPHNNPGSELTVRVRDAGGQTGEASIYQPSTVPPPGSEVWTTLEQNDGQHSTGSGVALQGGRALAAGVLYEGNKLIGTLRRFDKTGKWKLTPEGWSKEHTVWTGGEPLVSASLGPTALAVDAEQNIILVGTAIVLGEPRLYLARFHPGGDLDWELLENVGTEARGVAVRADGTIYVTGARRTNKAPDRWDMATWVYSADKTAHGPDIFKDPADLENERNERGWGIAVLKSGRIAAVGTREVYDLQQNKSWLRGVIVLYEGKGKRVGEWTSQGDKMNHDALLAVVATDDGLAGCGYAQNLPNEKTQILLRWFDDTLTESKAPRLELTTGAAQCNAIGFTRDGKTLVGGSVHEGFKGGDNAWIFAVKDAAEPSASYLKLDGPAHGIDRVTALSCDYTCAWTGFLQVGDTLQWITGMIRG